MTEGLIWVVLVGILLSGFFALATYSLREFRRSLLEQVIPARRRHLLEQLDRHGLSLGLMTSLCRSVINALLMLSILAMLDVAHHDWPRLLGGLALAAGLIAVFGVAIPHAWAAASCERILAAILGPLLILRFVLWPVVVAMQAIAVPVRRLSGVDTAENEAQDAKQDILEAASEGRAEGAVDAEEVRMIKSVIEFGEIQAGEIMTPRTDILALPSALSWRDACQAVFEGGHTRIPIYEGDIDNIIGVLYAKDLLQYVGKDQPLDLRAIARKPYFVPETKPLDDLLREFKARKVHVAIVLDEYGGTAGLVSIEDVLEEIVGDIRDEYDAPTPALMKRLDDQSAEVDGRMYIGDLNDAMALHIPEDENYDTIAGFVFSELGYIPSAGEMLEAHDARITVLAADERRITRIKVERLGQAKDTE